MLASAWRGEARRGGVKIATRHIPQVHVAIAAQKGKSGALSREAELRAMIVEGGLCCGDCEWQCAFGRMSRTDCVSRMDFSRVARSVFVCVCLFGWAEFLKVDRGASTVKVKLGKREFS